MGFTNRALACDLAEQMFLPNGRKKARSAVMTLTDGKPSSLFQTCENVLHLKDKHVKLGFLPVTEFAGEELALMKKWASSPRLRELRQDQQLARVLSSLPESFGQLSSLPESFSRCPWVPFPVAQRLARGFSFPASLRAPCATAAGRPISH